MSRLKICSYAQINCHSVWFLYNLNYFVLWAKDSTHTSQLAQLQLTSKRSHLWVPAKSDKKNIQFTTHPTFPTPNQAVLIRARRMSKINVLFCIEPLASEHHFYYCCAGVRVGKNYRACKSQKWGGNEASVAEWSGKERGERHKEGARNPTGRQIAG